MWMNLTNIRLGERSQAAKGTSCRILFIQSSKSCKTTSGLEVGLLWKEKTFWNWTKNAVDVLFPM
jgi:hypothetical protein